MRALRPIVFAAMGVAAAGAAAADFGGRVRPAWTDQQPSTQGPLAQAAAIAPDIVALPVSGATLETELRASGDGLFAVGTGQEQRLEGERWRWQGVVNELYAAGGPAGWQFAAGKRIVAWDVGYAFRPNDVVQQEPRRRLLPATDEGRPIVMAEYFDASTAVTLVAVNPSHARAERGAEEPALAARLYQRDGPLDWHGFARWGAHTRGSAGAAVAWVASDSTELHASLRYLDGADTKAIDPATSGLVRADPWADASVRHAAQALVGGTWTNEDQLSLLAEAWWDGTALSNAQWDAWNERNRGLAGFIGTPAPTQAVAANLAWQASAFQASSSLRRANLFARLSWTHEHWEPALDLLYTPADGGRVVTAALGWQGDRTRVDIGWRVYGGRSTSVLAQLPARRVAVAAWAWSF